MREYLGNFVVMSGNLIQEGKDGCYVPKQHVVEVKKEIWSIRETLGSYPVVHKSLLESYRVLMFSICELMHWQLNYLLENSVEKDQDSNIDCIPIPLNIFIACTAIAAGEKQLQALREM